MIKSENRLRGKRIIQKILSKGSQVRQEHLSCRVLISKDGGKTKLTVVVSKKISPLATVRNRIKRRVREAFEAAISSKNGLLVVVFPQKSALDASFDKLQEEAKKCLENQPSS